jgi:hypothetical protein
VRECVKVLIISVDQSVFTHGQFSARSAAALSLSLPAAAVHSQTLCSLLFVLLLQRHFGLSDILYLYRYGLMLLCPVTAVVKFGVTVIFSFNLSANLGKNDFVIVPFVGVTVL